jgi:hypothetical protein
MSTLISLFNTSLNIFGIIFFETVRICCALHYVITCGRLYECIKIYNTDY